jgi:hypothetical protein
MKIETQFVFRIPTTLNSSHFNSESFTNWLQKNIVEPNAKTNPFGEEKGLQQRRHSRQCNVYMIGKTQGN